MYSSLVKNGAEEVYIFNAKEATILFQPHDIQHPSDAHASEAIQPMNKVYNRVVGVPASLTDTFGNDFYLERPFSVLAKQTREEWQLHVEGQLCNIGMELHVTDYDTLRSFIQQELGDWKPQEVV